jgi:cytoskeletal protein CcmA (bactofilin family)
MRKSVSRVGMYWIEGHDRKPSGEAAWRRWGSRRSGTYPRMLSRHMRFPLTEQPSGASLNPDRRTEEHSNMAQQADDLSIPMKLRPAGATMPPRAADPPRLGAVPVHAPGSPQQPTEESTGSRGNEVDRRTLIIGQGISLAGEVTSCDRLIVEGTIEAKLQKCQNVIIAETGFFNGHASTENADVRGHFEGELVVRKRLLIRAGGHVSGTVSYGEIEIESGGKITGVIEEIAPGNLFSSALPISA